MTDKKPNLLFRLLRGIWLFIDGSRRLVVNIVFVLLVILIVSLIFARTSPVLGKKTALVLNPVGYIVEQYSSAPIERAVDQLRGEEEPETRFRDMLHAIRKATNDPRIERMVLEPDYIWSVGPAQLQELAGMIDAFKAAGKQVVAYTEGVTQHQYFLAALADEIWLHPEGIILLEGYGLYRNYYKDALDRLEVNVHLFRVGEYKSAGEPFVRNDMSPESREANLYWLGGLWQQYLERVATQRGLSVEDLEGDIMNYPDRLREAGGTPARMALEQGLVDRVADRAEFNTYLAEAGAWSDDGQTYRQVGFETYIATPEPANPLNDAVAVIVAQGPIMYGEQPPGTIGGESTVQLIRNARTAPGVKALVLRVDSPGGSVLPSEKIRRELQVAREEGLPVLVSMGTVAASGGYWISMASDLIFAEPGTITGSIGIFGLLANIPKTLAKIGVYTDGVGTTPLAGAFRIDRELPEEAADLIQQIVENGYEDFIERVAEHREMSREAVDTVARGRVWTGAQALDRGLIDRLGGLTDAVDAAAELAGLGDSYRIEYFEEKPSAFEQWLLDISAQLPGGLFGARPPLSLANLQRLPDDLELLLSARSEQLNLYSFCFCDPR
ncbi:MAG: signal peptide peptidase SppA [Xanthomonadales bacterium]|nr:signal peptide peptidase SppA [Xanthomonadales bacterium]